MKKIENKDFPVQKLTRMALLSSIVVVLQIVGMFAKVGELSINLSLVPVVIGAVLYGPLAGGILGLVSAVTILATGQATFFLGIHIFGTLLVVFAKGFLSGYCAGVIARLLARKNTWLSVFLAAAVCPIVNTGIFLIGCRLFFYRSFVVDAAAAAGRSPFLYLLVVLAGFNFLFELFMNLLLSPVIVRVLALVGVHAPAHEQTEKEQKTDAGADALDDRKD